MSPNNSTDLTNPINIAVVGSGYWGKNLVRVFWELGSLHTICDIDEEKLEVFKSKYPDVKRVSAFKDVLKDKKIKGVVIATPAVHHYQMAKQALLSDKDVFVEKPLSLTVGEGKELVKLAEEKNKILMVGHILQYHRAVIKLKELINKGELGKIQYVYSNRLNIGRIRPEENILWSFAPHDISVILMFLNEFPDSVYATGGNYLQQQTADVTLTTMDFPSGVKAHIFVSWLHPFKEQKMVVVGDKKMAVFDDISGEKLFLYPHRIEWINRIPTARKAKAEVVPIEMEEPLKAECKHFLECIEKRLTSKTNGREGLRVLEILQACQESLDNTAKIIQLSKREKPYKPKRREYFVHESSYIDDGVEIGSGTKIWHFSHILRGSRIGKNCKIGQNVVIGPNVTIGNGSKIQNNVSVYEGVTLEDDVFCGPSMVFTNVFNPRCAIPRMKELRPTLVKKGATIGANATIICGHTIGMYSFIGAGAVVIKDVPDYALVVGNPGRISSWMCECGEKLFFSNDRALCGVCGKVYMKEGEKVAEGIQQISSPSAGAN